MGCAPAGFAHPPDDRCREILCVTVTLESSARIRSPRRRHYSIDDSWRHAKRRLSYCCLSLLAPLPSAKGFTARLGNLAHGDAHSARRDDVRRRSQYFGSRIVLAISCGRPEVDVTSHGVLG